MSRNAFVPMTWITSDLNGEALRTLILISTFANAKTGECHPSNALLSKSLGKSMRSIQLAIQELKSAGLISIVDFNGKKRTIRIESPEWFDRPTRKTASSHEENLHGRHERNLRYTHEENLHGRGEENLHGRHEGNLRPPIRTHPINTPIEHNSNGGAFSQESKRAEKAIAAAGQNLEPFESGLPATMPAVRNGIAPFRNRTVEIVSTKFKPETAARMVEVLDTESDQFKTKVTQEQADAGFVDWVLMRAESAKRPIGMAMHLLKTAWREDWVDPQAAEDARLEEMADMIRSLK